MFRFDTVKGVLKVHEKIGVSIYFCSTILGPFTETFRFKLEGSAELQSILFSGHVRAPSFSFDQEIVNFGKVSFSFPYHKTIKLKNTSKVAFNYHLRIPGDGKLNKNEFTISPNRGRINAGGSTDINLTFYSIMPKKYDMVMCVDIEGVGQDMCSLPIIAESEVPNVKIEPYDSLNYGKTFLNSARSDKIITLINDSSLMAKYEVLPQTEESKVLAEYSVDKESGHIAENSKEVLTVTLKTNKLGEITLPISISIVGNASSPHTINITANSVGPEVELDAKELDFGNVEVLTDKSQKITITNRSLIEADFHAFTKQSPSIFKPLQKHAILKPQESMSVEVICNPDDAIRFQDTLHFVIKEGAGVDVILKAKGVGSTIFCKDDLKSINFDTQYTFRAVSKEIFIENKGRKEQTLHWQRKKPVEKKKVLIKIN